MRASVGLVGLLGPSGLPLHGIKSRQLVSIDQVVWAGLDGLKVSLLDVSPKHGAGHPDLLRRLGNCEQPSLLHAGKVTEPATPVIDYHGCSYSYPLVKWLHEFLFTEAEG